VESKIYIFESQNVAFKGVAFNNDCDWHVVNVTNSVMSLLEDQPAHFCD